MTSRKVRVVVFGKLHGVFKLLNFLFGYGDFQTGYHVSGFDFGSVLEQKLFYFAISQDSD